MTVTRQGIKDRLKPELVVVQKPSPKEAQNRRTYIVIGLFFLGLVVVCAVVTAFFNTAVAGAAPLSDCSIGHTDLPPHENHVDFEVSWHGGEEDGEYPWTFGDESGLVLTGTEGIKQFDHDYGYTENDVITYTAGFTFTGGTMVDFFCHTEVVIDYRPEPPPPPTMTVQIFLPIISNQIRPTVELSVTLVSSWNHVQTDLKWTGAKLEAGAVRLDWGDGSWVEFYDTEGTAVEFHDYPWPGGSFTLTFTVTGPGGTTVVSDTVHLVAP